MNNFMLIMVPTLIISVAPISIYTIGYKSGSYAIAPKYKPYRTYVWEHQYHVSNGNNHLVHCDVYFFLPVSKKNDDDIMI